MQSNVMYFPLAGTLLSQHAQDEMAAVQSNLGLKMQSANQELQVVVFKEKLYSSMRCFSSFLSCWQQLPKQLTSIQDLTEHHSCSSGEKIQRFCSPDREEKNEANNLLNPAVRNSGKAQNYPRQQACCTSASSAQPVP